MSNFRNVVFSSSFYCRTMDRLRNPTNCERSFVCSVDSPAAIRCRLKETLLANAEQYEVWYETVNSLEKTPRKQVNMSMSLFN
jgi:hypothetical protein